MTVEAVTPPSSGDPWISQSRKTTLLRASLENAFSIFSCYKGLYHYSYSLVMLETLGRWEWKTQKTRSSTSFPLCANLGFTWQALQPSDSTSLECTTYTHKVNHGPLVLGALVPSTHMDEEQWSPVAKHHLGSNQSAPINSVLLPFWVFKSLSRNMISGR